MIRVNIAEFVRPLHALTIFMSIKSDVPTCAVLTLEDVTALLAEFAHLENTISAKPQFV
jgi:hypothetical protein